MATLTGYRYSEYTPYITVSAKESHICECISNVNIDPDIVKLDFEWHGKTPKAGQFFLIKSIRSSVFLGRPISVCGCESSSSFTKLSFLIALKGRGSRELAAFVPGQKAELIGPLGNCFSNNSNINRKIILKRQVQLMMLITNF